MTGNVLKENLGLQGAELGAITKRLTDKLVDGDISLDSDFVKEAKSYARACDVSRPSALAAYENYYQVRRRATVLFRTNA
jgi:hypothetical protein